MARKRSGFGKAALTSGPSSTGKTRLGSGRRRSEGKSRIGGLQPAGRVKEPSHGLEELSEPAQRIWFQEMSRPILSPDTRHLSGSRLHEGHSTALLHRIFFAIILPVRI